MVFKLFWVSSIFVNLTYSKSIEIPYTGAKQMGTIDVSSGFYESDTVKFGNSFVISSYSAGSLIASCGAGGEVGLKLHASTGSYGVDAPLDTIWTNSTKLPPQFNFIGKIPTRSNRGLYNRSFDTTQYDGYPVADLLADPARCAYGSYKLLKGNSKVFYFKSNLYSGKFQIYDYHTSESGEGTTHYTSYLHTFKIRYILNDQNEFSGTPVTIYKSNRFRKISHNNQNRDILGRHLIYPKKLIYGIVIW